MDSSGGTGDGAEPQDPRPIRPGPVIGGIVLGLVLAAGVQTLLVMALSGTSAFSDSPAPLYAIYLVPASVGVGLLASRRTRQAGAGLLLGLGVGAIVVAGACAVITTAFLTSSR